MPHFASIAGPLHAMFGKGKKCVWIMKAQQSLGQLKLAQVTSPPVLAMPTDDGEFVLDTNSSDSAINAVLSHNQGGQESRGVRKSTVGS